MIPETRIFELKERHWDDKTGTAQLQLRIVEFQNINSSVMLLVPGEGTSDRVRLDRMRIKGRSGVKKEPVRLQRADEDENEPRLPIFK